MFCNSTASITGAPFWISLAEDGTRLPPGTSFMLGVEAPDAGGRCALKGRLLPGDALKVAGPLDLVTDSAEGTRECSRVVMVGGSETVHKIHVRQAYSHKSISLKCTLFDMKILPAIDDARLFSAAANFSSTLASFSRTPLSSKSLSWSFAVLSALISSA